MRILPHDLILFLGDSVTDNNRDRADYQSLSGYTRMIADTLTRLAPDHGLTFLNRGVGGDRTADLLREWNTICADLYPDVVSVLIGINDTWRRYDQNLPTSTERFEENYRRILDSIRERSNPRILLMEPFLLSNDPEKAGFREDLDPKIQVVRRLAREYRTDFIPLDGIFAEAEITVPCAELSFEGIHLTEKGDELLAGEWVRRCNISGGEK